MSRTGDRPAYWRSLDQLADTPEFREWVEREFPAGASELTDPVTRRHFVKIMSASFLLAGLGLSGCRRPVEKIIPFSRLPENYVHGVARYYATAMPCADRRMPLVVKVSEGVRRRSRATRCTRTATVRRTFAQASVLDLYDPTGRCGIAFGQHGETRGGAGPSGSMALPFSQVTASWGGGRGGSAQRQGQGLSFCCAPALAHARAAVDVAARALPKARWLCTIRWTRTSIGAATLAFRPAGGAAITAWRGQGGAELDSDFLGRSWMPGGCTRRVSRGSAPDPPTDEMSRLVCGRERSSR
jgi:MoCo/4Fe-4S cofactor protein with predicted Tat translocation signal